MRSLAWAIAWPSTCMQNKPANLLASHERYRSVPIWLPKFSTLSRADDVGIFGTNARGLSRNYAKSWRVSTPRRRARLDGLADYLVRKEVWIVGGDGWAYDIGYGGLDHVLASGHNVNILVMDTEGYSNTGGQQSKATTLGSAAKFATAGKAQPKKGFGPARHHVRQCLCGIRSPSVRKTPRWSVPFTRPPLMTDHRSSLPTHPCIEHGYDLGLGIEQMSLAVDSGYWPLYRYDPQDLLEAMARNRCSSTVSCRTASLDDLVSKENRFRSVRRRDPERYDGADGRGPAPIWTDALPSIRSSRS